MSAQSSNNELDWSTHGMPKSEMIRRIKQNRAMATAASQRALEYNKEVSPEIKTWLDANPNRSPWLTNWFSTVGGYKNQVDAYNAAKANHNTYVKRMNTALGMTDKLNVMNAKKLKKDLNKLLYGSK